MKTSEIRALLEHAKVNFDRFDKISYADTECLLDAIETLLARQAEVDKAIKNARIRNRNDNVDVALYNLHDEIRAILEPEEKP